MENRFQPTRPKNTPEIAFSADWSSSPIWSCPICWDPARSRQDLAWSLWDLAGSLWDWAWSCWVLPRSLQVRPNLVEISQDLFEIRSDSAKISRFRQKSDAIRTIRARPKTDRKTLSSDHPNRCHRRVGDWSIFRRPEVIGSVLGWV